jgi:hypothetical protein
MARRQPVDPLTRPASAGKPDIDRAIDESMPLFAPPPFAPTTKQLAHVQAESKKSLRYAQILTALCDHGALAIFEVAEKLGVPEHAISGRFGELERDGRIEKTGTRKPKPNTTGTCNVYRLKDWDAEVNAQ